MGGKGAMKSPREILLERHQAADSGLNAVRKTVLANECQVDAGIAVHGTENRSPLPLRIATKIWMELIWPVRRIWAGFAVVWIAMAAWHYGSATTSAGTPISARAASSEVLMVWLEQKTFVSELTGASEPSNTDPPRDVPPKPRSQRWTAPRIG
jgi:hypothetical protein